MSDGPYKSLKMRPGWKQLAKRADEKAFASEEVRDALPTALEQDWRAEVADSLCRQVQAILQDMQLQERSTLITWPILSVPQQTKTCSTDRFSS